MKKESMVFLNGYPVLRVDAHLADTVAGAYALLRPTGCVSVEEVRPNGFALDFLPYFAEKMVKAMRCNRRSRVHRIR